MQVVIKQGYIFGRKKHKDSMDANARTYADRENQNNNGEIEHGISLHASNPSSDYKQDDISQDLMHLVGKAIDEWAMRNGLNNLPRSIIFKQALAILNALNLTMSSKKDDGN